MGGNLGFYRLRELNRLFGRYGNLKGSFACVETSAFMLLWNFGVAFVGHRNFDFKIYLHIPLGWWGAFGMAA